jgi:hypothetical protein
MVGFSWRSDSIFNVINTIWSGWDGLWRLVLWDSCHFGYDCVSCRMGDSAWEKNHLAIYRVTNNVALLLHRINLIDKSRLQGEAFSYAGSDLVWKARLFLFVGFALLGFGFAGSCVSTRRHRQRELYSLIAIFMVECDDYQVYRTSWWTRPLLRCGSGHSMWIDHA